MATSECQPVVRYVKCEVPDIPKPALKEFTQEDTPKAVLEKLYYNYHVLIEHNKLLQEVIDQCRK